MTAPSETFDLSPGLRSRANEITGKYRMALATQMAEELVDAGIPMNLAFQITVGELAVSAARVAMIACVGLEKREPRRDLWMKRAEENFDEAREWFANLQTEGRIDRCPICAEPFNNDDICATDIELMTCHAACLEGSPVVDLDSGEPLPEGEIHTYRYRDETQPTHSDVGALDRQSKEYAIAQQSFRDYFARNYPGPNTIIHDPDWHAPKIFRAAVEAVRAASEEQS